jgi:predicted lipoprotein with Yx(FWY)xxD motif
MATSEASNMFDRKSQQTSTRSRRRGRPSVLAICAATVTVALVASFAAMAFAIGSAAPTVGAVTNAKFGAEEIVVDAHGRTLYVLSPETTRHLLCKSSECLKIWPPLTVRSHKGKLTAGPGVHGHLGILRRSNGTLQVTLGGMPLYRFSGDGPKGTANGESIESFGGTWHVLSAATDAAPTSPAPETTQGTPSYPSTPSASTPAAAPAPAPTPTTSTPTTPTTTTPTPTTPTTTTPPSEPPHYPGY